MNDIVIKLKRIKEALSWQRDWNEPLGDSRDEASLVLWSSDVGEVWFRGRLLFTFEGREEFDKFSGDFVEANRYKTPLERVDWSKS